MRTDNSRHFRTALTISLLLHGALLVGILRVSFAVPPIPANTSITVSLRQFVPLLIEQPEQPATLEPAALDENATDKSTAADATRAVSGGQSGKQARTPTPSPPASSANVKGDSSLETTPGLDLGKLQSGIAAVGAQVAKDRWKSGKDWCPDDPPRRVGEPCKTNPTPMSASQQAFSAVVAAGINAHDARCSIASSVRQQDYSVDGRARLLGPPARARAEPGAPGEIVYAGAANFEPHGGGTSGGSVSLLPFIFSVLQMLAEC